VLAVGVVSLLAVATLPVRVVPAEVVGDGCPSGAAVETELASLLTAADTAPEKRDVATLERRPDTLHIELADPDGVVIAERTLDSSAPCAELARMTAIVIASWESDVHPEFVRQPVEIAHIAPPPPPEPERPAPVPTVSRAAYDVAGGVTLGQSDTLAAGASLGAAWFPRGVGLGLWILGAADMERTIAVGAHDARWRRWMASAELARRWARGDFVIDPHAGLTLGWIATEGVDYTQNLSASTVSLGGTAGLRVARWMSRRDAVWRAAVWIDVRGFYFPRRDFIYGDNAGGTAEQTAVPSWGGIASVGLALGRPDSR
jgi:hypothetical protein